MKTIEEVTLYDLMAEDLDVWVTKHDGFGFHLEIDNEEGDTIVKESSIHPFAADSLADFCRRYLACYDRVGAQ